MKLVVKNKKRFRSFIFSCIALMLGLGIAGLSQGATGEMQVKQRVFNVQKGDTIWKIAHSIAPAQDTRTTVKDIMQLNNMSSPQVYEHQALYVPETE